MRSARLNIADLLTLYGITDKAEREQMLLLASRANQRAGGTATRVLARLVPGLHGAGRNSPLDPTYDAQFVPALLQTETRVPRSWPG